MEKERHLEKLFSLNLFELTATYNVLTVIKFEMGSVPSARNHPSFHRFQTVGAVPECFSYSKRSCSFG